MTISSTESWLKSLSGAASTETTPEQQQQQPTNGEFGSAERNRNVAASLDFVEVDQGRQTPSAFGSADRSNGVRANGSSMMNNNNSFLRSGNERLYEAYNELHSLAQDFRKPFDAPAILVVGHQTDGKSALVEALMGFQFNHVGGGTKTRRPITLHMKYNSTCVEPHCFLIMEGAVETEVTLEELQEYIESENRRLEAEHDKFWAKEIVVRIEYKYCPNLTIIDTPGLISAAPGRRNSSQQQAQRQVEALVRSKMEQREYIVLCLEDTADWGNATTRKFVMQVDPMLERTVIVSTKLDTRIPQFARGADVELFLRPPSKLLESTILGGSPFYTSVPSGRVGISRDAVFRSNDHFREAVASREANDVHQLEKKLGRKLDSGNERSRVGVSQLRRFLEQLLQQKYFENVPSIVPLLEREHRGAAQKLDDTVAELNNLQEDRLKERGRHFRERFLAKIHTLMKGTISASPERFGETLADEHIRGGAFLDVDGQPLPHYSNLANKHMRLYGGAQYHRAMAEFRHVVGQMACSDISREEIVNSCGVDDVHDGVNYTRTACVIAISKAKEVFEPYLYQLGFRMAHIARRMLPIGMHLLQRDGEFLNGHDLFLKRVGSIYYSFIEQCEKDCIQKCLDDLKSTTRYVTWSLHNKNRAGLRSVFQQVSTSSESAAAAVGGSKDRRDQQKEASSTAEVSPQEQLVDLLEGTLWTRRLGSISEDVVAALVCRIFEGIRDFYVQSMELKFNCFFLMPLIDDFPAILREELERCYAEDLDGIFDVASVRSHLEHRQQHLDSELEQVKRLQTKFAAIHSTLSQPAMNRTAQSLFPTQENPGTKSVSISKKSTRQPLSANQLR
ncbi:dynamin-like protein [Chloropicon primus]|uniref:Dynamin-like protein n=1 Tax=Chloropicon primus TaxID=1764295 RepID=A0A5B8MPP0_9CHLO|nr:dynamin-like protein [Chloropicon primus]UPR01861.1 dynamin-like protein [Chloropicon primus]|eukprot:QDZ22638.1 dynamin-like protein [Chloropicon primus]